MAGSLGAAREAAASAGAQDIWGVKREADEARLRQHQLGHDFRGMATAKASWAAEMRSMEHQAAARELEQRVGGRAGGRG
jgi:hypothetical protein